MSNGLQLIAKGADFSAIAAGVIGLTTSVTSGLQVLHFLGRGSAAYAVKNYAPGGTDAVVSGSPTFSEPGMAGNVSNNIRFGAKPTDHGFSMAAVFKNRPGAITISYPAGSHIVAALTQGATYFELNTSNAALTSISFPDGSSPPLSSATTLKASIAKVAGATWEMYIGDVEDNASVRLYHPKDGTSASAAASTRDFVYDNPNNFSAPLFTTGSATDDVALFASWNRLITPEERATFYAEMKAQLSPFGVAI